LWPTPEPAHRINQIYFEPILFAHAAAQPRIRMLNRTVLEDFTQDGDGVMAVLRDVDNGERISIACSFLIGCDGGKSTVRKRIRASFQGTPVVQRVQSTYIRAPALASRLPGKRAWMYFSLNPRRCGTTIAIDGRETWLIHNFLYRDETDFESVDRDWAIRTGAAARLSFRGWTLLGWTMMWETPAPNFSSGITQASRTERAMSSSFALASGLPMIRIRALPTRRRFWDIWRRSCRVSSSNRRPFPRLTGQRPHEVPAESDRAILALGGDGRLSASVAVTAWRWIEGLLLSGRKVSLDLEL